MMGIVVSRRDKMRRFEEISHIELLVSVERYENVVYCGEKKVFIKSKKEGRYSTLKTGLGRKSYFGKG